jgi:hypothetical protein
MAVTIDELKERVARLEWELSQVSAALDELARETGEAEAPEPQPARRDPLAGIRFTDTRALQPVIDKAFAEMGIDITQPAVDPVEVQELMLREGVRPEDNLGSRAIIEAREE